MPQRRATPKDTGVALDQGLPPVPCGTCRPPKTILKMRRPRNVEEQVLRVPVATSLLLLELFLTFEVIAV